MKIQFIRKLSLLISVMVLFSSCKLMNELREDEGYSDEPNLTPLQVQLMQTKVFNVSKKTAFDATVTVFQNLGYIISMANLNTGFITAKSPEKSDFFGIGTYNESTAFITELGDKRTSIRINFVNMHSIPEGNAGEAQQDDPVENAQAYENAFAKIQQQIFVNTGISPVLSQPVQKDLNTINKKKQGKS